LSADQPRRLQIQILLFTIAFAGFSLGVYTQTTIVLFFGLVQIGIALATRRPLLGLVAPGRRAAAGFVAAMTLSAVVALMFEDASKFESHWPIGLFWTVSAAMVAGLRWEWLHRALILVSVPGLLFSCWWLVRPDEFRHALDIGFHMYPRATGFVSNAITNAEGLAVLAAWTLARLDGGPAAKLGGRERKWLYVHLTVSVLVVVFSRVRAGILGFTGLLLLHAFLSPRWRRFSLTLWLAMAVLFLGGIAIFGFNMASIRERVRLVEHSVHLVLDHPVVGIGPKQFERYPMEDGGRVSHPHNTLLGVAAETGLLGLAAYLLWMGVLVLQLRDLRRRCVNGDPLYWPVQALTYAYALYWIFGFFDYNLSDTELTILHSLHWSLITGLWWITGKRRDAPAEP